MERVDKVIITNRRALARKHGRTGMRAINAALARLVNADRRRGVRSRVIAIDTAADMQGIGRTVKRSQDARAAKRAIDAVYRAFTPDYLMLLGAPDVIPYVRLKNPMAATRDEDRVIESDLPYACDAPYSTSIQHFLGPGRVVGRLPDVRTTGDTAYLVRLLNTAAAWKRRPRSAFRKAFVLSAQAWRSSTRGTAKKLTGTHGAVRVSPHEGPDWTPRDLAGRVHLINCHGAEGDPHYYGENTRDEEDQPIAHHAPHLRGRVTASTVVAAECCYGAELYAPSSVYPPGICQEYLGEGAAAFFGSTTTAYGPEAGHNFADIICGAFLRSVLEGASVGRAALAARQHYVSIGGYMEMIDLKTVAQFVLLGDPSIHPVQKGRESIAAARAKARDGSERRARRKRLTRSGKKLVNATASVGSRADARPTPAVRAQFASICADHHGHARSVTSFRLHAPAQRVHARMGRDLAARRTVFHAIVLDERPRPRRAGKARRPPVKPRRVLMVREVDGKIKRVVEAIRHGR